jgi:probable selenium-dependent hydroxylase accessory protein YqeC
MTKNRETLHPVWQDILAAVRSPLVVTLIGGGGKTSLMYYLVAGLKAAVRRSFAVATAKLFAPEGGDRRAVIINSLAEFRQAVDEWQDSPLIITLAGERVVGNQRKLAGLDPAWVDTLAGETAADLIVEGDGSAGLPLKGHLEHDPVVPAATRLLVPVVGVDVLGRPLATPYVHRPARAAELAGVPAGTTVSEEIVARLLLHPDGYLHNCPPGCLVVPFINKAEAEDGRRAAVALARTVLAAGHPAVAGVVIGSIDRRDFLFLPPAAPLAAGTASFSPEK